MKQVCETCRFWSDLMARCDPQKPGEMLAMCLNAQAEKYQEWTSTNDSCALQRVGEPLDVRKRGTL